MSQANLASTEFLSWLKKTGPDGEGGDRLPTPARAALAHLRFETIHPYSDGNGRIGRALADYVTSQSPTYVRAPFSLSRVIQGEKEGYYQALQQAQGAMPDETGKLDVTPFVRWFSNAMERGLERARDEARYIVARNGFFNRHGDALNARQEKVLRRLFEEGPERLSQGISARPYQKIAQTSPATATRDLADLASKGIIDPGEAKGRSAAFTINLGGDIANPVDGVKEIDAVNARAGSEQDRAEKRGRGRSM